MMRSVLPRLTSHLLSCSRGSCLLTGRLSRALQPHPPGLAPLQQSFCAPLTPGATALVRYSDLSEQKYTAIYAFPHIKFCAMLSKLKLIQTTITVVILPPVYYFCLHGSVSFYFACYTTGVAMFAGVMLYVTSYFLRKVVGMMYLDPSQSTLKVSHLTFWGRRHDVYLPVSDVMTIWDTGDSANETILKLKRYSSPHTMYFSTHFGRVVDKEAFEKVFGKVN